MDPPTITVQPDPQLLIVPGQPASFTVTAFSQDGILSYQWQKDGVNLPTNANSATYTISSVMESDEGQYRCVVSNAAGTVTSDAANLTVCKCNGGVRGALGVPKCPSAHHTSLHVYAYKSAAILELARSVLPMCAYTHIP